MAVILLMDIHLGHCFLMASFQNGLHFNPQARHHLFHFRGIML
jgi:hypothetical protein